MDELYERQHEDQEYLEWMKKKEESTSKRLSYREYVKARHRERRGYRRRQRKLHRFKPRKIKKKL